MKFAEFVGVAFVVLIGSIFVVAFLSWFIPYNTGAFNSRESFCSSHMFNGNYSDIKHGEEHESWDRLRQEGEEVPSGRGIHEAVGDAAYPKCRRGREMGNDWLCVKSE